MVIGLPCVEQSGGWLPAFRRSNRLRCPFGEVIFAEADIAVRIELLMRETPFTPKTAVVELLTSKKVSSPRAKRKHSETLIRHLREEKVIAELRIVADYFDVGVEFLVFGVQSSWNNVIWCEKRNSAKLSIIFLLSGDDFEGIIYFIKSSYT